MLALWLSDLPAMQTVSEMRPQSPISKLLTRFELSNQAGFCIISRIIQLLRKFMESIDSINRFASNTWNWGLSENMAPPNPMEHLLAHHFPNMKIAISLGYPLCSNPMPGTFEITAPLARHLRASGSGQRALAPFRPGHGSCSLPAPMENLNVRRVRKI